MAWLVAKALPSLEPQKSETKEAYPE